VLGEIMTRGKCRPNSESNSFAAAAEQVCLQRVLEHRQRRGRFILSPTAGSIINTGLNSTPPPPTRGGRGKNRHAPGEVWGVVRCVWGCRVDRNYMTTRSHTGSRCSQRLIGRRVLFTRRHNDEQERLLMQEAKSRGTLGICRRQYLPLSGVRT